MHDNDGVACLEHATLQHDGHDPGLSDQGSVGGAVQHGRQKAGLEGFDLRTRVAKPGDLDQYIGAQAKLCTGTQAQQVDALGGDVLAHLAGSNGVSEFQHLGQEFLLKQVHLPKVGLCRVPGDSRPVFDGDTEVGIIPNAMARDELDLRHWILGEGMKGLAVNGEHRGIHGLRRPMQRPRLSDMSGSTTVLEQNGLNARVLFKSLDGLKESRALLLQMCASS